MSDVTTAPLCLSSLERRYQHQPPAPFTCATVKNHVPAPVLVYLFEIDIEVEFRLTPRNDEDQVRHDCPRWLFAVDIQGSTHATPFVAMSEDAATGETEGRHAEQWAI